MSDLEMAFHELAEKAKNFTQLFNYYDGNQPLTYTNARLREVFKDLDAVFIENWCQVVIDSVKDKINLKGVSAPVGDPGLQLIINRLWENSQLALESDEAHEAALVTGEAFVIVWPDEQGVPQAYFNDPRLCHVCYEAENPRKMRFAAKWWCEQDGITRLTLYYADRLEYYQTREPGTATASGTTLATGFVPMDPPSAPNPYGEIPVFHLQLQRRICKGDLASVVPIQNGINKLLCDMMVAAEFGAFNQRYVISNADVVGKLKNAPNEIWLLPGGDGIGQQTQAGQFSITPLENYLKAIDSLAMGISSITRTPKHYFFAVGSNLSGEALLAMEAGLNKKAGQRIERFSPVWRGVMAFMLRVMGIEVLPETLTPNFERPETLQPRTVAETRNLNVQSGLALATALRYEGRTELEISQALKEKEEEANNQQVGLGQALLRSQRAFDQGAV